MSRPSYEELENLEKERQLLRTLIDSLVDYIYIKDTEGRFILSNRANALALGEKNPEDILGKTDFDCLSKEDATYWYNVEQDIIKNGRVFEHVEVLSKKNSNCGLISKSLLKDSEGKIIGIIGINSNITKQKETERELISKNERLKKEIARRKEAEQAFHDGEKRLLRAQFISKIGDFVRNIQTGETLWSEGMYQLLKYDKNEKINFDIVRNNIYHPEDRERVTKWLTDSISSGKEELKPNEFRLICKDGEIITVQANGIIEYKEGKASKLFGTWLNITERKQLEEQLQTRQRMDSLGTLAGGIAHDFNNILAGIMGNINILNIGNDNFTEKQKRCLNEADKSCERAADLIRQFQSLSKGAIMPEALLDIYDITNEVFNLLKETTERIITKQINFKKGEFFLTAVPMEIQQVLLNLGLNSVEAIEEKGVSQNDFIRITAENHEVTAGDNTKLDVGKYVHITFEDSGTGMSKEVLNQAFDPLFSTKDRFSKKGQGLGLTMVYNIVSRKSNGHIWIESELGTGTTFHIYLPLTRSEIITDVQQTLDLKTGTETILVVDDEPLVINLAENILSELGYTVLKAHDGQKALEIYRDQKDIIKVVLLDLSMPHMSGKQLFQEMTKISPDANIIISSGYGEEYTHDGILAGANGYINKPYKMIELAQTIRTALDS